MILQLTEFGMNNTLALLSGLLVIALTVLIVKRNIQSGAGDQKENLPSGPHLNGVQVKTETKVSTPIREVVVRNRYLTDRAVWVLLGFGFTVGMVTMFVFLEIRGFLCQ